MLAGAILFFVTEWLRVDLVAFLAMLLLAVVGIISHDEALAGFSSQAVITIASVLVLSAGLVRTGVAQIVGHQIMRLAGESPLRLMVIMMATVGVFSGIMNNIGVAALLLPVILEIARRMKISPSKLLIPLAFASLLGGLTTLIGTAPNILISGALEYEGFEGFDLFDFTPVGMITLVVGIAYMIFLGRHLLPDRDLARENSLADLITGEYDLQKRLKTLTIPEGSHLIGKTLMESRLGSAVGFNVLAILRNHQSLLAPGPQSELQEGDKLLVEGRRAQLETLRDWKHLILERGWLVGEHKISSVLTFAELQITHTSSVLGKTLTEAGFRNDYGINVLAIKRGEHVKFNKLRAYRIDEGDTLVVMGFHDDVLALETVRHFTKFKILKPREVAFRYHLHRQIIGIRIPAGSSLAGKTLQASKLKDAMGINILGLIRGEDVSFMPPPDHLLQEDDIFLVLGQTQSLDILDGLQNLRLDDQVSADISELESDEVGVAEVALTPRTTASGKTLGQIDFRERFGLTVLAIWRGDRAFRTNLRDMVLEPGDALLVYGERHNLARLGNARDFMIFTGVEQEIYKKELAPVAGAVELGVLATVAVGWLPIYIAAPLGAALMVLTRCITPDDAYRAIEWKAIVLIASMLGLGLAMEKSGASALIAHHVVSSLEFLGVRGVIAGVFLVTAMSAQVMPTAAVAVIMAPIAISTAVDMGYSPHALAMVVVLGSSSAFLSPVGHPVNLLVMSLGGYRFTDYTKVGLPLVMLLLLIALYVLPLFWPV